MELDNIDEKLIKMIEDLLNYARSNVVVQVNNTLLLTYMEIGKEIVKTKKLDLQTDDYKVKSITNLSKALTKKFGRGFSRANIWNMINFYEKYGTVQTLSERLTWSHYCELLSISDNKKRSFYEKECFNSKWSVRELRRQIGSSLYERLLLSSGDINKKRLWN